MRIQHNIMAMNAYRNYNNNNKALSGNLEKLSSGYKINRAGDDAAGLAISEKMRAQITGLNAAQKNVKDGISLVKTAEGAMQEIQDMLNRMDYLATQSANGTYDNEVDRANLQKEVENLKTEINRIADSANFNGIKLLDGSLDENAKAVTTTETVGGKTDVPILQEVATDPTKEVGTKTVLRGKTTTTGKAEVNMALHDLSLKGKAGDTFKITVGDAEIELEVGVTAGFAADTALTGNALATVIKDAFNAGDQQIGGQTFTATLGADGNSVTFTQANNPTNASEVVDSANLDVKVEYSENPNGNPVEYKINLKDSAVKAGSTMKINDTEVTVDTNLTTTFNNKTIGNYETTYANGVLTIKDPNGTLGKPQVTYESYEKALNLDNSKITETPGTAAGTAPTVTVTGTPAVSGFADGNGTTTPAKFEVAFTGVSLGGEGTAKLTINGQDITSSKIAEADKADADKIAAAFVGKTVTIGGETFTAALKGGSTDTLEFTAGTSTALTGGTTVTAATMTATGTAAAATKATATYDLSELKDGDLLTIGSNSWIIDTDLATTLAKNNVGGTTTLESAIKTAAGNADHVVTATGNTLTLTAKEDGDATADADKVLNKVSFKISAMQETAAEVKDPAPAQNMTGTYNVQTTNHKDGGYGSPSPLASTTFDLTAAMVKDGTKLTIGKSTYVFKVGADSEVKAGKKETLIDLSDYEAGDANLINAAGKALADQSPSNTAFTIGYAKDSGKISIHEKIGQKDYDKELQSVEEFDKLVYMVAPEEEVTTTTGKDGKPLTLQIGDTSDTFNQMKVSVGDMHTKAMGTGEYVDEKGETVKVEKTIADIDIGNQEGAAEAVQVIKNAINYVSSVRGDLGAIQNRLDHTANNLSVMAENIQDAESTIRDTDVAEEMMSYVKNNILVQSAQAMLAQANQVPQGVLQLLG